MPKRKCKNCGESKDRETMFIHGVSAYCSRDSMIEWAIKNKNKGQKIIEKVGRKICAQKKKELMSRSKWYAKLQKLVNQYVTKVRDVGKPCCTCGTTNPDIKYDAGHCFTVGGRSDIRFDLSNIHIQCSQQCNVYGSGMVYEHKQFIIFNLGQLELDRLERQGKSLKEQFPNWQDIGLEIIRYRILLRDNNITPIV